MTLMYPGYPYAPPPKPLGADSSGGVFSTLLWIAGLGVGGYLLYDWLKQPPSESSLGGRSKRSAPGRASKVKVPSIWEEDQEDDLYTAMQTLDHTSLKAIQKHLSKSGFKGAEVGAHNNGVTVYYDGQTYRFDIVEND